MKKGIAFKNKTFIYPGNLHRRVSARTEGRSAEKLEQDIFYLGEEGVEKVLYSCKFNKETQQ